MTQPPQVYILMGSDSDLPVMQDAGKLLAEFGVAYRIHVASAHRTPDKVKHLIDEAIGGGAKVFIAGAGYAAHLAGFIAAHTTLPVIGVPLEASSLNGLDALLATVQMPPGIPVATVAVGKVGAKNAAILAVEMLATSDRSLQEKLTAYRRKMAETIETKDRELQR
ncbi:MAG: 5-(carboxyamino)imidazole ribonucleotide mutase [Deltaproteobacteria bacterium]|nr:5-(carboxyamino)imidazole ribonucleotide mutase [Deltaproteobacteria bacterium]